MSKLVSIFILIFALNTFGYSQQDEIYIQVINDFAIGKSPRPSHSSKDVTIIALNKPSRLFTELTFSTLRETYLKLSEDLFTDFYRKNKRDISFEKFFPSKFDLVILHKDSVPTQKDIEDKFPKWNHKIIELSNVGFNKRKDQAMVYYGQHIGSRAAGGIYVIYKLKKGKWKQKKIIPSWSS